MLSNIFRELNCGFEHQKKDVLRRTVDEVLHLKSFGPLIAPHVSQGTGRFDVAKFMEFQQKRLNDTYPRLTDDERRRIKLENHYEIYKDMNLK